MMELYDEGRSLADRMEYFDGMFTIMSRREEVEVLVEMLVEMR